ncbi:MAG: hypothetical protein ABSG43_13980 [Solirubrobacteraceae bacterium]|jgi:hypothetical protein
MMPIALDDAHEKARWAQKHYDELCEEIDAFQQRDEHRITVEIDADAGEYVFHVFDLPETNPDWGLRIGDCLHNARTALDYLMVRLWALITRQDPRDVKDIQFPIYGPDPNNADPDAAIQAARGRFQSAVGELRKEMLFSGYLATIEQLQPFNTHNPSVWGFMTPQSHAPLLPAALDKLSRWDNIDKHRVINAAVLAGGIQFLNPPAPPEFKYAGGGATYATLEEGTEIGRWRFETPLPFAWEPTQKEMKGHFPIEVALDEPIPPKGILMVLPLCLWGVNTVLEIFDPVFSSGQSPLPVTVSVARERTDSPAALATAISSRSANDK